MSSGEKRMSADDEKIVDLYWGRDERAIEETDKKYRGYLFSVARNILGNSHDCDCRRIHRREEKACCAEKKEKQMAENRSCCGVFCGYSLFAHSFNFKPNRRKALPFADGY